MKNDIRVALTSLLNEFGASECVGELGLMIAELKETLPATPHVDAEKGRQLETRRLAKLAEAVMAAREEYADSCDNGR